jgi:hypothetical protein
MKNKPETPAIFDELLNLEKIEPPQLDVLNPAEKAAFIKMLYDKLKTLTGSERDAFMEKTGDLLDQDQFWEYNHTIITEAIKEHAKKYGAIPSKAYIAAQCGLSRQTVHKHLKNFTANAGWTDQMDAINIMTQNVMGTVLRSALTGDLRAARLYLDAAKGIKAGEKAVNNQNNYIQINKTVINQQLIQQLRPEQLDGSADEIDHPWLIQTDQSGRFKLTTLGRTKLTS